MKQTFRPHPPLVVRKISIIIPAYCEEKTISQVIHTAARTPLPVEREIIVVDDGSHDRTAEQLRLLQKQYPVLRIFQHASNLGKGAALRTGFAHVLGEVVLIQDADLEYDPADYNKLLEPLLAGDADVVYGSRFLGGPQRTLYFWHFAGNRLITLFSNMLSNLNLNDIETCYKAFDARLIPYLNIKSDRFGFEAEFTMKIAKLGCRVYQVPISYRGRTYAEGKKITWKDGIAAFWHLVRFRFFD